MSEARKPGQREVVAARIRRAIGRLSVVAAVEGVQLLNPGYFQLERIRTEAHAKDPKEQRQKLRSGNR